MKSCSDFEILLKSNKCIVHRFKVLNFGYRFEYRFIVYFIVNE